MLGARPTSCPDAVRSWLPSSWSVCVCVCLCVCEKPARYGQSEVCVLSCSEEDHLVLSHEEVQLLPVSGLVDQSKHVARVFVRVRVFQSE